MSHGEFINHEGHEYRVEELGDNYVFTCTKCGSRRDSWSESLESLQPLFDLMNRKHIWTERATSVIETFVLVVVLSLYAQLVILIIDYVVALTL